MIALGKVQEHLQQLASNTLAAALRPHGDVGDVALVQHHLQAGITHHPVIVIQRHQESGQQVVQLLRQHIPGPGGGEADALQLRHLVQMVRVHRHDAYMHPVLVHRIHSSVMFRRSPSGCTGQYLK